MTDAKLGEVALVAGCSRSVAIAAWHCILESAATCNAGGDFDATPRRVAVILGEPPAMIEVVFSEMEDLGMISDGSVSAWRKRQYESDSSTERSRKSRERAKPVAQQPCNGDATLQQQDATPPDTDTDTDIPNHLGACELETLEKQLREAAGWQSDPSTNLFVTGPVHQLIVAGGCSLELDVLPTIRSKAPRLKGRKNWNYFLEAIQQARDDRLSAARPPDLTNARGTHANTQSRNSIASSFAVVDAAIAAREAELERLEAGAGIGRKGVELLS